MTRNEIKEFIYWYVSSKTRYIGFLIIIAVLIGSVSFDIYYSMQNGETVKLSYTNEIGLSVSLFALTIGFILQSLQIYKDSQKRAFIFQHFGASDGKTFNIAKARPLRDKLNVPETYVIDAHQFYKNGSIKYPQEALKRTLSIEGIVQAKSRVEDENSKYYYGGIAQVPLTFVAGTLFENTRNIQIYDWNRVNEKTYLIENGGKPLNFVVEEPKKPLGNKIIIEVALTYPIDHNNTVDTIGDLPTIKIQAKNLEIDNTSTKEAQESVYKEFHRLLDKYFSSNVNEIHVFVSAQNSMVFQLGRQLNKRVHKEIIVWQYEAQNEHPNPWGVSISNDGYKIIKNRNLEENT